ncbi:WD40 repeat-like protein [Schizopora paradoxa]|uniref:WD40 repeat-like protein n=1 Tax=Schizopora paradoxa TaxID=27342 RepID=A0A0H2R0K0_9AGAM|nr:WD40 repeat-like protein [Schizopora paradoxa]
MSVSPDKELVTKEFTLAGHSAGVECLAISPDGRTLVSGDDAASIIVWNLTTGEQIQSINCPFNGAEKFEFVSVTSGAHNGPIEDLSFDAIHCRLASVGGGHPQVWKISNAGILSPMVENVPLSTSTARSVSFAEGGCSILVGYLESGEISCFAIEPWGLKWTKTIDSRIGCLDLCKFEDTNIFVSNLVDGVDLYRLPDVEKIKTFPHTIKSNFPLQVTSSRRGSWLVSGGDSGFARLFDRRSGQFVQSLSHGNGSSLIQSVSSLDRDDGCVIVTGSSDSSSPEIIVWKERKRAESPLPDGDIVSLSSEKVKTRSFSLCEVVVLVVVSLQLFVFFALLVLCFIFVEYKHTSRIEDIFRIMNAFVN